MSNNTSDSIINKQLKLAIIGFGHIGKKFYALCQEFNQVDCVAVVDPKQSEVTHTTTWFPSLDDLLSSNIAFDLAYIAVPNYLHTQIGLSCIDAGKDIIIEKPMGLRSADCKAIIEAAEKHQKQVFCVMQNRYSPPSAWLKNIIEQQLLGRILYVEIHCIWNRSKEYYEDSEWKGDLEKDGGTLFTQFSHFVDTLYWLFGKPNQIQAEFFNLNHTHEIDFEDTALVRFQLPEGGKGHLFYSTSAHQKNLESSITVLGEKGSIKIGGQYMNEVLHCSIHDYTMPDLAPTAEPNSYGTYQGSAFNHRYVLQNVLDVKAGKDSIKTTANEGLHVVELIEEIYAQR